MEWFLAQCGAFSGNNMPVLLSVSLAGLVGSATHCSVMCSPLVAAQIIDIKNSNKTQWLMLLYHMGRISTYMVLGMLAVIAGSWLFSGHLSAFSNLFMLLAGAVFLMSAIRPRQTHTCPKFVIASEHRERGNPWISKTRLLRRFASRNDGIIYLIRGALMGFMPCGMVLAALMMIATLDNVGLAALSMVCFGLATTPIMQLAGLGALSFNKHYPTATSKAGRAVMACNGLFLCSLGLNLVSVN